MDVLQFSFCQISIQITVSTFYLFFSLNATSVSRKTLSREGSLQLIKPALFVRTVSDTLQYSYFIRHFESFPGWKHRFQRISQSCCQYHCNAASFNFYFQKEEHMDLPFVKALLRGFYSEELANQSNSFILLLSDLSF